MTKEGGHLAGVPKLAQYAKARRAGNLLFLAGVSSRQPDNSIKGSSRGASGAIDIDIREQTKGCIENLRSALEGAGLGLGDLVDVTVFLVNMADYGGFNEAWNDFFTTKGPTRTTVSVHQLPDPDLAIELKAIAAFE
jgi:2-aminomuconate deaminase